MTDVPVVLPNDDCPFALNHYDICKDISVEQGFSQAPVLPSIRRVIIDLGGHIMLGRASTYQVGRLHLNVGTLPTLTH